MNIDNIKEQLDRLSDELINDIINTPDSEILQEVKEDYGTSDYLANKFREIFGKSKFEIIGNIWENPELLKELKK